MPDGILDTIGLAATLVFALPVGLAGVAFVERGNLAIGLGLISVGIAMVLFEEYLTTPGDIPGLVVSSVTSKLVGDPDNEEE
jgi:hypothetical protein